MNRILLILLIVFGGFQVQAQDMDSAQYIVVKAIEIKGNKKTKEYIVLRELDFKEGDTIQMAELSDRFARNRKWLVNKDLFNEILFNIGDWDFDTHQAVIKLDLQESWYIYPLPLVELADRNFNVWWDEHDHTLKRINLGLAYYQNNTTGRNDKLVIIAQGGFTQKAEIEYALPAFKRKKNIGVKAKVSFIRNKTVGYRIDKNYKELFDFKEGAFLYRRFRTTLDWTYRPDIRLTHTLLMGLHHNRAESYVVDSLNYNFFGNGMLYEKYPSIGYRLRRDFRDINLYTMKGNLLEFNLNYDGAIKGEGPDKFFSALYFAQYFKLAEKWSTELVGKGVKTFHFGNPSYIHSSSLGGSDFIRGYEYYALNGQDYVYAKTSLRYRLLKTVVPLNKWFGFKDVAFRMFLSINNDVGVIKEHYFQTQNALSEKTLWGKGIGLDLVMWDSRAIQIEYSLNHFGEKGLFLHLKLFN